MHAASVQVLRIYFLKTVLHLVSKSVSLGMVYTPLPVN